MSIHTPVVPGAATKSARAGSTRRRSGPQRGARTSEAPARNVRSQGSGTALEADALRVTYDVGQLLHAVGPRKPLERCTAQAPIALGAATHARPHRSARRSIVDRLEGRVGTVVSGAIPHRRDARSRPSLNEERWRSRNG